jgi:hypothetical protein
LSAEIASLTFMKASYLFPERRKENMILRACGSFYLAVRANLSHETLRDDPGHGGGHKVILDPQVPQPE